jgi:hypothetical protein
VFPCSRDKDHFVAADSCGAATHVSYFVYNICGDIFLWIPTSDGDAASCLGGGDDTAWLFCSEYNVPLLDEIAGGLLARNSIGGIFSFVTRPFDWIPTGYFSRIPFRTIDHRRACGK